MRNAHTFLVAISFFLTMDCTAVELSATTAKDTMAVMDFNAANASASDAATLSGFIRGAVVRSDKYLVVEKKNMDKILAEQAFQQTGCTSSAVSYTHLTLPTS